MVAEIEIAFKSNVNNKFMRETIKQKLMRYEERKCRFGTDEDAFKTIQQKMRDNNVIITKADKGGSSVLIKKQDYINKVGDIIYKERIQRLATDPTNKYQIEIKKAIKNAVALFNTKDKFSLITMNLSAPNLYALLKNHKEDLPIRPVWCPTLIAQPVA